MNGKLNQQDPFPYQENRIAKMISTIFNPFDCFAHPWPGHTKCMALFVDRNLNPIYTPLQNWSKYKKVVFKQDMVYMNLEGNWTLATPLTGLGCARSYYENFSAKFTNFLNQKITGQSILKTDHLCHLHF